MTLICDICEKPIYDGQTYQQSLTGEAVHIACLETIEDEEDDHGE